MSVYFWFSALCFGASLALYVSHRAGIRSLRLLKSFATIHPDGAPKVSIVLAACNEEKSLQEALASLLSLDYPNFEIIAVNDRSTDKTGEILQSVSQKDFRLRVLHVQELPEGWLGKNHALNQGAQKATGEFILFTDADIVFEPTALSRAIKLVQEEGLDHLAVAPDLKLSGWLIQIAVEFFIVSFSIYAEPWKARDPKSSRHVGIGAFNLARTSVYRVIGGHQKIALRPDDDMKLGKLIKKSGFKQDIVKGQGMICVQWYASVWEMARGLEKNSFAGVEYSAFLAIGALGAMLFFNFWPVIGLFVGEISARFCAFLAFVMLALNHYENNRDANASVRNAVLYPLGALIFFSILARSVALTLVRGDIQWRGTNYSLVQLKKNTL